MDESLQNRLRAFLADEARRDAALLSSGYQGSVYLYEDDEHIFVIKKAAEGFLTGWLHRTMLRREAHVYALLAEVDGVPHSPGFLDATWLVLDFVEGRSLKQERRALQDPQGFYERLREIILACHAAGVAHGDLKRKENILVDRLEQPHIIDFGTAVTVDGSLLDRLLFAWVRRIDLNAWIKVKYDRDYDAITPEDRVWYRPSVAEAAIRTLQRIWRTVSFRQARKRRRRRKAANN